MDKKKSKKVKTGLLAAALCGVMGIGGLLAYFTDAANMTNIFTVGKVSLALNEPSWSQSKAKSAVPNQIFDKDPQITNDGKNDEYVFLRVDVPYAIVQTANVDGTRNPASETQMWNYDINPGWTQIGSTEKDTEKKTYTYTYVYGTVSDCTVLKKDSTTGTLFDDIKFANVVEDTDLEDTNQQVSIYAYGIQTDYINHGNADPAAIWEILKTQTEN